MSRYILAAAVFAAVLAGCGGSDVAAKQHETPVTVPVSVTTTSTTVPETTQATTTTTTTQATTTTTTQAPTTEFTEDDARNALAGMTPDEQLVFAVIAMQTTQPGPFTNIEDALVEQIIFDVCAMADYNATGEDLVWSVVTMPGSDDEMWGGWTFPEIVGATLGTLNNTTNICTPAQYVIIYEANDYLSGVTG